MAGQTVVISVLADTKKAADGLSGFGKTAGGLSNTLGGVGKAVAGMALVAGAAVAGFVALSVKAAAESEKIAAQTAAALESTGAAAQRTAEQVGDLSLKLSRMSGVDDEVIQSGANVLLTFTKIQGLNFDKATQAALDLSVALGKDMGSAATLVGKALNDPIAGIGALSRVGVQLTDDQKALIESFVAVGDVASAQGVILSELQTQFGGSAEAFGNTFLGSMGRVQTAFGNLQESIGSALLPVLTILNNRVADFLNKIADSAPFNAMVENIKNLAQGVLDGTASFDIGGAIAQGVQAAADWLTTGGIATIVNALVSGREAFFGAALQVFPALVDALVTVVPQLANGVITLITSLVAVLVSSAPTLLAGAIELFLGLVQGITAILPTLITQLVGLLPVIVTALVSMVPSLIAGAIQLFSSLIQAVVTILPGLITQLVAMLPEILTALIGLIPQLIEGAIQLFTSLVAAVPLIIPELINAVIALIPIIIDTLINLLPVLLDGAVDLMLAIVDAVPIIVPALINGIGTLIPAIVGALIKAIPKLIQAGVDLLGGLIESVGRIVPRLVASGRDLIQGFIDGIKSMAGPVGDAVGGILDFVAGFFPHSPAEHGPFSGNGWRSLRRSGLAIAEQFGSGLESYTGFDRIMDGLSSQITGGFTAQLDAPAGYRGGYGGNVYNVNLSSLVPGPEVGRQIVSAIEDFERVNGRR